MNQPQLPAHLQGRASRHLAETATQGLGGALPPHISIRGNQFRLVDAAGNEQPVVYTNPADNRQYAQPYLDVCIIDLSDVICKQYYGGKAWTPESNDPPVCWSSNGIGPSREASQPQSRTCAECPKNVRGSDVSKISGVAIKACRDEKWAAVTLPGFARDMVFQLKLTPGSFQNWKGYVEKFKGTAVDISDVVTRLEFEQGVNGVLKFDVAPQGYIDPPTADLRERVLAARGTDIYVGRNDQPITHLAAPQQVMLPPASTVSTGQAYTVQAGDRPMTIIPSAPAPLAPAATAGFQPGPIPAAPPPPGPAAPPASFPFPSGTGAAPVAAPQSQQHIQPGTASPSEQAPPRRRRRTQAEMEASRQQPAGLPMTQTTPQPAPGPAMAPFRPVPGSAAPAAAPFAPAAPPPAAPPFGVGQGVPPNPELAAMLDKTFGPAGGPPR